MKPEEWALFFVFLYGIDKGAGFVGFNWPRNSESESERIPNPILVAI